MGSTLLNNQPTEQTASQIEKRRRRSQLGRYQMWMAYLFVSPALILFFLFAVLPALMAFILSFSSYDILTEIKWIGLNNYQRLISDDLFFTSLRNVFSYAILFVPSMIALSLSLALALNRKVPGMQIFRTLYYFPMITSSVAASTIWIWMLHKDYGLINQLLSVIGVIGPAWLNDSDTAMLAVVLVTLWQGLGGNMIVYLAGLQGIPQYLYESARLDGANAWQMFRYITWPSLQTTTFFVVTMSLIGAFQLFDQSYIMTRGGPGHATLTTVFHIYQTGFNELKMGYASALAFVLFLIILTISLINIRINRENTMF
jgi:multiple sugar transport system permease protein